MFINLIFIISLVMGISQEKFQNNLTENDKLYFGI